MASIAHSSAARETQEERALALLHGQPDPHPPEPGDPFASTPAPAVEPQDRDTIAWRKWATAQTPQDPDEYQRAVAGWKATVFEELSTGRAHARDRRRQCSLAVAGRRGARPRGSRPQRSSASRSHSSTSASDSPEPGPRPEGEWGYEQLGAALRSDPTNAKLIARVILRLSVLACDYDALVSALEEVRLSDLQRLYLDPPLLHLTHCNARAGQLVYEGRQLDQRPRNQRLGRVA